LCFWARREWNRGIWKLHQSHHEPREGAFEQNDVFAVANAVPAIALILYGFLNEGVGPGICFGAGCVFILANPTRSSSWR
jgi:beta-carotene 3-hydroxylase